MYFKVDVNVKSNGGYTPLHIASFFGHNEAFDVLTCYDADLSIRDNYGRKARQYFQMTTFLDVD